MENYDTNNVTEGIAVDAAEVIDSEIVDEVVKKTFAERHPCISTFGTLALMGSGMFTGVLLTDLAIKGIKKGFTAIREKRAAKKKAKAQEECPDFEE